MQPAKFTGVRFASVATIQTAVFPLRWLQIHRDASGVKCAHGTTTALTMAAKPVIQYCQFFLLILFQPLFKQWVPCARHAPMPTLRTGHAPSRSVRSRDEWSPASLRA